MRCSKRHLGLKQSMANGVAKRGKSHLRKKNTIIHYWRPTEQSPSVSNKSLEQDTLLKKDVLHFS
jgi:hypothetical protein